MSEEADNFWHDLDAQLDEEERALAEFRDYLNGLSIEEALAEREIVLGWEQYVDTDSDD